jgi:AcrR family transcriptional regulator
MLTSTSYRDVKVIDIAREAGTSPATFYQYFPDVEAAILVLAEQMAQSSGLATVVQEGPWRGRAGFETAARLVDGFLDFWEEHRPVLRVVDLATDEGDVRFRQIRVRVLAEVTDALAGVIHPSDVDSRATAGALVSMLAHVAAHRYGFEFWGIRTGDLRLSMARMIFWAVTGQKPPG